MRPMHAAVFTVFSCFALACGSSDAGPSCPRDADDVFLGSWKVSGSANQTNGARAPISFPLKVKNAANCTDYLMQNGDCAFSFTPVFGEAVPTLSAVSGTSCNPGASTAVYANGTATTLNGSLKVTLTTCRITWAADGGVPTLTISGVGTLGNQGINSMAYDYTATR